MWIKAVIFDMDGVLIDAKEWHYESLNRALAPHRAEINRVDHLRTFDGLPTKTKLEMLSQTRGLPRELHAEIQRQKQAYLLELVEEHCRPFRQHVAAIRGLKLQGLTIGVASNSVRQTVDLMLSRADILPLLDFTLSNQDVSKSKPDPEIYLAAMRLAGVQPSECVVVEDNQHGVEAATRAGAHVMRVETVNDVELSRIRQFIAQVEQEQIAELARRRAA
jgi:beta-phosphoglucomutase